MRQSGSRATKRSRLSTAERELSQGQRAFRAQASLLQPREMFQRGVVRPIDDTQILTPTALHGWLEQALRAARHEVERLDDHPLATLAAQLQPPAGRGGAGAESSSATSRYRRRQEEQGPTAASRANSSMCQMCGRSR